MFDFDAGKFLIIGVVALIVIGPKELPRVLRQVGQMVGRVRRMATEFQGQFMDAMKEADIESIRQDLKKISDEAETGLTTHFDPARDIQRELTAALDEPAAAAAVPATTELPAATEGFALPPPDPAFAPTIADDGAAPTASEEPAADAAVPEHVEAAVMNGATGPLAPPLKRKIRVPKRAGPPRSRTHAVSDRTAIERSRVIRLRGQELVER